MYRSSSFTVGTEARRERRQREWYDYRRTITFDDGHAMTTRTRRVGSLPAVGRKM